MKITQVETSRFGTISTCEAIAKLSEGLALNVGFSQVVMGVYEDGRRTSLKGRRDGLYYMSGNYCSDAA